MIGLTGAQRTGKSTLAGAFSVATGIPVLYTSTSGVFKALGLDPTADYPIEKRLDTQRHILDSLERQYRSIPGCEFIADRTPIDLIAYMLADVQRSNMSSKLEQAVEQYMKDCFTVSNAVFSVLVAVQPGITPVEAEGKAPATFAYTEHISNLVMGLLVSEYVASAHYYIPRGMTDLEQRVECAKFAVSKTRERFDNEKKRRIELGVPFIFH